MNECKLFFARRFLLLSRCSESFPFAELYSERPRARAE